MYTPVCWAAAAAASAQYRRWPRPPAAPGPHPTSISWTRPPPPPGYDVTLFEKSHEVGGVWQSNYAGYALQVRPPASSPLGRPSVVPYSLSLTALPLSPHATTGAQVALFDPWLRLAGQREPPQVSARGEPAAVVAWSPCRPTAHPPCPAMLCRPTRHTHAVQASHSCLLPSTPTINSYQPQVSHRCGVPGLH